MKGKKKLFGPLLCLILFVPYLSNVLYNMKYSKDSGYIDRLDPKLAISGTISLKHGVSLTISGFSNKSIEWAYICSPMNICIEVRVLNTSQYDAYKRNNIYNEYLTLSNRSDYNNIGNFSVPYPDKWHLSFWNLDPTKVIVKLTFDVKFHNLSHYNPTDLNLLRVDLVILGFIIAIISSIGSGIVIVIFRQKRNKKRILETLQNTIIEEETD